MQVEGGRLSRWGEADVAAVGDFEEPFSPGLEKTCVLN